MRTLRHPKARNFSVPALWILEAGVLRRSRGSEPDG